MEVFNDQLQKLTALRQLEIAAQAAADDPTRAQLSTAVALLNNGAALINQVATNWQAVTVQTTNAKTELEKQIKDLQAKHVDLQRQYDVRQLELTAAFADRVTQHEVSVSARIQGQVTELESAFKKRIAEHEAAYKKRADELAVAYSTQRTRYMAECSGRARELEAAFETQLADAKSSYDTRTRELAHDCESQLRDLQCEQEASKAEYKERAQELEACYEAQYTDCKDEYERRALELEANFEHRLAELEAKYKNQARGREAFDEQDEEPSEEYVALLERRCDILLNGFQTHSTHSDNFLQRVDTIEEIYTAHPEHRTLATDEASDERFAELLRRFAAHDERVAGLDRAGAKTVEQQLGEEWANVHQERQDLLLKLQQTTQEEMELLRRRAELAVAEKTTRREHASAPTLDLPDAAADIVGGGVQIVNAADEDSSSTV
ncbi:hypothetical protein QBC34DRAFT_444426 [Podospora aff. communis PSN243]|uniref:Uncharacterized protein n=1 Tax=Podospora aff. communis PSN243 TaxID=3040156 RepID=A0AAV9FVT6_9PEZI|nr:hypothetical protein QBC34DRAFT_444426 [Podospora aff. communis PSN243]